jgi:hypothetical protein
MGVASVGSPRQLGSYASPLGPAILVTHACPLTDIREIGILQSFTGWREPNAV